MESTHSSKKRMLIEESVMGGLKYGQYGAGGLKIGFFEAKMQIFGRFLYIIGKIW